MTLLKYPRTRHIQGSKLQHGDHDLSQIPWIEIKDKHIVVEEKVDGANVGISFDDNNTLKLQSRGHYLIGGPREKQFELFKSWASRHQFHLRSALGQRYVMFGEWLYAKHTCFYDALPHYFMEFDIFDRESQLYLSTTSRRNFLANTELNKIITSVLVLCVGSFSNIDELSNLITNSNFKTSDWKTSLLREAVKLDQSIDDVNKHTDQDDKMEGLYIKQEEANHVVNRYKYVRSTFTSSILNQNEHWSKRTIIPNCLRSDAFDRIFL